MTEKTADTDMHMHALVKAPPQLKYGKK